jgi:hypothetical protein
MPRAARPVPQDAVRHDQPPRRTGRTTVTARRETFRALGLGAVAVGLLVLTATACVVSYPAVHHLAGRIGISPTLATVYPVAFDAMLVVAAVSVLALRGAGLPSRLYAWLCLLVAVAGLAAASVAQVAGLRVPHRAGQIGAATIPFVLVLAGFGLLVALLRYARLRPRADGDARERAAAAYPARALALATLTDPVVAADSDVPADSVLAAEPEVLPDSTVAATREIADDSALAADYAMEADPALAADPGLAADPALAADPGMVADPAPTPELSPASIPAPAGPADGPDRPPLPRREPPALHRPRSSPTPPKG